jgi:hypothetical protein
MKLCKTQQDDRLIHSAWNIYSLQHVVYNCSL